MLLGLCVVPGGMACEPGVDLFYECAGDGRCPGGLSCYRTDTIRGYCTGPCYGSSTQCPANSVCYRGVCLLACTENGEDCPGETACYIVQDPHGLCMYEAP
jgi:hypothetical protein